ncbi:MAG: BRCT domain-containing protein, partial [Patescibacteria group bacterium]|nr:BRCT domain-containing protein [Patescibacteria group bacterium]
ANHFISLDKLKRAGIDELKKVFGIGERASEEIYKWFQIKTNQKLIDDLMKTGIEIIPPKEIGKKLKGKIFVLTGALESIARSEAEEKIRLLGGHTSNSVSKNTDYLVIGENPGSKYKKAKKLNLENTGLKILSEKQFLTLL